MDSVTGLGQLNYYKRNLIIRTKIGEIFLFDTVLSKKQGVQDDGIFLLIRTSISSNSQLSYIWRFLGW